MRGSNKEKVQTGTLGSGTRVEEDLHAASRNGTHDPPPKSKLTVLITESNETHTQTRSQIKTETDCGRMKGCTGMKGWKQRGSSRGLRGRGNCCSGEKKTTTNNNHLFYLVPFLRNSSSVCIERSLNSALPRQLPCCLVYMLLPLPCLRHVDHYHHYMPMMLSVESKINFALSLMI